MQKKKPLLTIRPVFDSGLVSVEALLIGAAGTVGLVLFGGTLLFLLLTLLGLGGLVSASGVFIFCFVIGIALIPAGYYEAKKRAYRRTAFLFYESHFEYQDFRFLITRRRGRIRYEDISNIYERGNTLQGHRTLTSVYIEVPGMPHRGIGISYNPNAFRGVYIPDVKEKGNYGDKIIAVIEGPQQTAADNASPAPEQPPTPNTPAADTPESHDSED
ncbi:MAG: hypothetical protein OXT65_09220 [Alphaproteobacteria bacterium]|nr:hypothetical protein [Alphaproteobacteria bacterium]